MKLNHVLMLLAICFCSQYVNAGQGASAPVKQELFNFQIGRSLSEISAKYSIESIAGIKYERKTYKDGPTHTFTHTQGKYKLLKNEVDKIVKDNNLPSDLIKDIYLLFSGNFDFYNKLALPSTIYMQGRNLPFNILYRIEVHIINETYKDALTEKIINELSKKPDFNSPDFVSWNTIAKWNGESFGGGYGIGKFCRTLDQEDFGFYGIVLSYPQIPMQIYNKDEVMKKNEAEKNKRAEEKKRLIETSNKIKGLKL